MPQTLYNRTGPIVDGAPRREPYLMAEMSDLPAIPSYAKCGGGTLSTTDPVMIAPSGVWANGFALNQEDVNGCATRSDWYYNRARNSHTGGKNYDANDAQGFRSAVVSGNRNLTATAASYAFIGSGVSNEIQAGTRNSILGGNQNIISAGSYTAIGGGFQNNLSGSYSLVSGYRHNITGYGNSISGYRATVSGNRSIVGGDLNTVGGTQNLVTGSSNTVNTSYNGIVGRLNQVIAGNYNNLGGLRSVNTAGSYNTIHGVDNNNIAGSYNAIFGNNSDIVSGNGSFISGLSSRIDGSYNASFGNSHEIDGVGSMTIGYNNTVNNNFAVAIGRNLVNTTQDGIMIGNSFQRLGFGGVQPIPRPVVNSATATTTDIVLALEALGLFR